jgi:hypothetical protein
VTGGGRYRNRGRGRPTLDQLLPATAAVPVRRWTAALVVVTSR